MMEQIKFSFSCRIIRKTEDGFTAILPDGYVIKFRDNKYKHPFKERDSIIITLENMPNDNRDEFKKDYSIIHVLLHSFLSNGFLFRDISSKKGFFWSNRGMLTYKKFEKEDIFQENEILKILIKRTLA